MTAARIVAVIAQTRKPALWAGFDVMEAWVGIEPAYAALQAAT
jgi:hypothetical protein